jgi:hypothetical protein
MPVLLWAGMPARLFRRASGVHLLRRRCDSERRHRRASGDDLLRVPAIGLCAVTGSELV